MPRTKACFFREANGSVPLLEWLRTLPPKARSKCEFRIDRLCELGHELRRPEEDYLRDRIHELRATYQGVHYRMLYFFHGTDAVVLSHGLVKERSVPTTDIDRAVYRMIQFTQKAARHTDWRP